MKEIETKEIIIKIEIEGQNLQWIEKYQILEEIEDKEMMIIEEKDNKPRQEIKEDQWEETINKNNRKHKLKKYKKQWNKPSVNNNKNNHMKKYKI